MQISILELSVENFVVFKDKVVFSMVSRKNEHHTFDSNGENLLRTSFVYGPNATGKTSLLNAFAEIRRAVIFSANNAEESQLPYNPFRASTKTDGLPTAFELIFSIVGSTHDGVYRYGFSHSLEKISREFLYRLLESGSEELIFERDNQSIQIGAMFEGADILRDRTRAQSLFLSVAAQFNVAFANEIINAFKEINIVSGLNYEGYKQFTINKFKEDSEYRKKILEYLRTADFCISDGETKEIDIPSININDTGENFSAVKEIKKGNTLILKHPVHGNENKIESYFELQLEAESTGTRKFLAILGPIIDTLMNGKVLLIDEFDNSLHPFLTKFIVDLFESRDANKKNAQLIVTTHDTSLLSYKADLIKDQFWFVEKNEEGASRLFSLGEFELRNDTEYAKKYLEGRFGGLPIIGPI